LSIIAGIKRGATETGIKAGIILSLRRDTPIELADKTVELAIKHRAEGVIALIVGDSTQGDSSDYLTSLIRPECRFTDRLHLGESPEENLCSNPRMEAIQPQRIGHAVYLCQEVWSWIYRITSQLSCVSQVL